MKDGEKTLLTGYAGDGDLRRGPRAIRRGDKFVDKVIEEASEYIGIATANPGIFWNPEVVVLGGGVIEALEDEMMGVIIETAKDYATPGSMKGGRLSPEVGPVSPAGPSWPGGKTKA